MGKRKRRRNRNKSPTVSRPRGRNYAASIQDRLTASFRGEYNSINEVLRFSLPVMRARSRQLAMDNDYAKRYLKLLVAGSIGKNGIVYQAQAKRPDGIQLDTQDNAALEWSWGRWGRLGVCTLCGRHAWHDVEELLVRALATDGEVLLRLYPGWNGNEFRFGIKVLEADWLDINRNERLANGNEIVLGVEQDPNGRPVAYHLLTEHPGRMSNRNPRRDHEIVPAGNIIHLFVTDRPEQARGVPWLHTAIRRLHFLGGYEEAEVIASRAASQKMGFMHTPSGTEYAGDDVDPDTGSPITTFEAGTMEQLPAGWEFRPWDPQHPTTAFPATVKQLLRGASAGLGVSYNALAMDLEGVSFSSIRAGVLEDRDQFSNFTRWLYTRVHDVVNETWLGLGLLAGAIRPENGGPPLPSSRFDKFNNRKWQARGWAWVDPVDDQEANERQVRAGWKTSTQIAAEQGRDLEDVYRELAREKELREQYGVEVSFGEATGPRPPAVGGSDEA